MEVMNRLKRDHLIETPKGPMTRTQAAQVFGIARNTIIRRVWEGWPPERVFEKPRTPKAIYVTTKSGRYRLADLVSDKNKRGIVAQRMRRGIPDHLALDLNRRFGSGNVRRFATPWGFLTFPHIARKIGITYEGLRYRFQAWPVEDALNTPPFGKRGEHFIMPAEEFCSRMRACEEQRISNPWK